MIGNLHLPDEALVAQHTFVRFFDRVRQQMSVQDIDAAELFVTDLALERAHVQVREQVFAQIVRLLKSLVTNVALGRFFAGVDARVSFDVAQFTELFAAHIASIPERDHVMIFTSIQSNVFV